ncbi:unnamed protein product [Ixodes hexagonus]
MVDIVDILGKFGTYHALTVFLVVLRAFPTAWTNMLTPMIAPDMGHWCARPPDPGWANLSADEWKSLAIPVAEDGSFAKCEMFLVSAENGTLSVNRNVTTKCERWEYDTSVYENTIVNAWDLVCSRSWHRSMAQSVVMAGALMGVLGFGEMSDCFGRKPTFFTCVLLVVTFGSLSSLAPGVIWYNAGRFLLAAGIAGCQATTVSLCKLMEIMPPKFRMMMNVGFGIGYTIPLLLLPLLAYYLSSWSYLQLATGLSALMMVPFWFILQESPRWLMTKGRLESAESSIVKILKINRRPIPDMDQVMNELVLHSKAASKQNKFMFIDFFRTPKMRRNTCALFCIWAMNSAVYYNVVLSATNVPGNPYLNYAISSSIEIPAALLGLFVAIRWSRRKSQAIFFALGSLSVLPMAFLSTDSMPWLSISSNVLLRFFILSAVFIQWIMVLEVFPTTARSFGFACCLTCSRCGAMLAPFLRDLGEATNPVVVPPLVLAALCLLSAGLTLLLPETLNKPLPDTFLEAENISR